LLIASMEFGVKQCVGFESIPQRQEMALRRIKKRGLSKQIRIFRRDFQDLFKGKIPKASISDATIVLYTLSTDKALADDLSKHLKDGCKLVYSNLTLFPEFMPSRVDYPFYVSEAPFDPPSSESDWLTSVLQRDVSRASKSTDALWSELYHDYNVEGLGKAEILDYIRRLKAVLRR